MANVFNPKDLQIVQQLTKEIQELKTEFTSLSSVILKTQESFNKQSRSQNDLKNKTAQLSTVDRELIKLDKQLQASEAKLTNEYKQVQKAVLKKKEAVRQSNEELKKQAGITRKSSGLFKSLTKSILSAGAAFISIGAAIKIIKDITKVVVRFSKAQSNLASILGKTKDEIRDLTEDAKKYGSQTKFTATQVSNLQTELAKLGFTQAEIKNSTRSILDLAAATNSELADAASVAGGALRAFNLSATETDRVTSVLAVATTKSALRFQDYGTILGTVGPIANKFGLSIEDTIAVLGKLRDSQFDASSASTAFRNILLKLSDPSSELTKRFGGVATTSEELFRRIKVLKDEGADLTELFQLTDVRAAGAFATMVDGVDTINELKESITDVNSELQEMVDTQLDNLTGDLEIAKSAWEGLILSFEDGTGIIATISRGATQEVTKLLNELTLLTKGIGNAVKDEALNIWDNYVEKLKEQKDLDEILIVLQKSKENISKKLENANKRETKAIEANIYAIDASINKIKQEQKANEDAETARIEAAKNEEKANKRREKSDKTRFIRVKSQYFDHLLSEKQLTEYRSRELDKRNKKFVKWLENENVLFTDDIAKQMQAEENVTEFLKEQEEKRTENYQKEAEKRKEIDERRKKLDELNAQAKQELEKATIQIATDQFNAFVDNNLNKYLEQNEAQQDILKDRLDKGKISEADYQKQVAKLEQQARIKSAQAEKKKSLFEIGINTASAIVKQLAVTPLPAGLPFIVAIAAIGAIQAGVVAAKPIPKFGFGSKGKLTDDTLAVLGDRYQHEAVILPDGNIVFSENKPQLASLPAGSEVKSGEQTEKMLREGSIDNNLLKKMWSEQKETTRAIKGLSIIKEGDGFIDYETIRSRTRKYKRRFS
jgi:TP901 family phage tail tape measure protein